jgi:glycosyltransferase involved in cell wall biosynthesis
MDYWPNVDAVQYFARAVLPRLRQDCHGATFWIVGSSPTRGVLELASLPGVVVTGRVPDVRPYLSHAAAVVAPLRLARGVQNKVLEAMAMARPVVASTQAAEGIDAVPGRDFLVADTPEAMAGHLLAVARDGAHRPLGPNGRSYVLATYDWQNSLCKLDASLTGDAGALADAPADAGAGNAGPGDLNYG